MSIALVQKAQGTSTTVTLEKTVKAKSLLVLVAAQCENKVTEVKGGGVSWYQAVRSAGHATSIWYGENSTGTGTEITLTAEGALGSGVAISVSEWSGVRASGALGSALDNTGTYEGATTPLATPSIALADAGELVIAANATGYGSTHKATTGFTSLFTGTLPLYCDAEYRVDSSSGTIQATWEEPILGYAGNATVIAAFRPASSTLSPPESVSALVYASTEAVSKEFTPVANSLIVAFVTAWNGGASEVSITDTLGGLSWKTVEAENPGSSTRAVIAYAIAPKSPSKGSVKAALALGSGSVTIQVYEVTGAKESPVGSTLKVTSVSGSFASTPGVGSLVMSLAADATIGTAPVFTLPSEYHSCQSAYHYSGSLLYQIGGYRFSAPQKVEWGEEHSNAPAMVAIEILEEGSAVLASVAFRGAGSLAASARVGVRASVALKGAGNLAVSGRVGLNAGVALKGAGSLVANARTGLSASTTFRGAGSLVATASFARVPPPVLTPAVSPIITNPFSYYAYDLLTGRFIGQGPLRSVSYGQQLNAASQLTGTIDLRDKRVRATNPIACTVPNQTFIVVDYQGSIIASGIVMTRDWTVESSPQNTTGLLEIQCSELWAYFGQRAQATDYSSPPYSGITGSSTEMSLWKPELSGPTAGTWDASLIACQILEDAIGYSDHVAMPYGNPLGGLGVLLSGEVPSASKPAAPAENFIAINYPYTSMQTVEMIVSQLSQLGLGVGFDFGIDVAYSAGAASSPIGTINLSYPRRGRTVAENHLMIDLTTARKYRFPEDGTQTANQVYEVGGSGAMVVSANPYPLEQGYALWERVMSRAQIQSANITNILGELGLSDLAIYSYAPVTPTVTLSAFDPNLPLGSFIVGDDVRLYLPANGPDGEPFDDHFPEGLDQEWRITAYKVDVTDEGDATVEYTFAEPPYLQALAPAV